MTVSIGRLWILSFGWSVLLTGGFARAENQPPTRISYTRDIKPIFEASCIKCHLNGNHKGGLRLDSRDLILQGGESGAAAIAHNSAHSSLIEFLNGDDPHNRHP